MVNANYIKSFSTQDFFWLSIYLWPIKFFEIIIGYSFHEKIIKAHDQRQKKLSKSTSPSGPLDGKDYTKMKCKLQNLKAS